MNAQIDCLLDDNVLTFPCPHCECQVLVEVKDLNCCIFRHGYYKVENVQVESHASKEQCDQLVMDDKVLGCCKPFKILSDGISYKVTICDYI